MGRLKKQSEAAMFTYFIQAGGTNGPIKIGRSEDPYGRMARLQEGNPKTLRLLAVFLEEDLSEEQAHEMFAKHRLRGEWFRAAPEIIQVIGMTAYLVASNRGALEE